MHTNQPALEETAAPESIERPTNPKPSLPFRDALRAVTLLEEKAAILDVLADQAARLFHGHGGKPPDYEVQRRDGSTSPANLTLIVEVSIEVRKMARHARERAAAILAAPVNGKEIGDLADVLSCEDDESSAEDEEPVVAPRAVD